MDPSEPKLESVAMPAEGLKFAVLGSPIEHSLSPRLHSAAFAARGLAHSYQAHRVENLSSWLQEHGDYSGLSITMPLKQQALKLADSLDQTAESTGAVNTLIRKNGSWFGANTDVLGLQFALAGRDLSNVVVVGSGATARSALAAMHSAGRLRILARNPESVAELTERHQIEAASIADLEDATVISTLPAGALLDFIAGSLRPTGVLLDVAYHPWPSAAAELWQRNGEVISGVEMLIGQAVVQQRLFVEENFDELLVLRAMRAALGMKE
jgi:shikimate dehydrogenase